MRKALLLALGIVVAHVCWAADKMQVNIVEASWSIQTTQYGISVIISAKVILPDGSHADLICGGTDDHCAAIEPIAPEKMPPGSRSCPIIPIPGATSCTTKNLGMYAAARKGNELTIYAPNGKLRFRIVGTW